ncbi:MAG TPA: GNAT family N-acetyltransferase [Ilumatobacteraceae bacterium]
MPAVAIAEGAQADLPVACDLWFLAADGPATDEAVRRAAVDELGAEMGKLWQRPPAHLFLARAEEELVGTVFGKPRRDEPTMGQISMLAVHPEWQRRGIGNQLMDAVLTALVEDECTRCRMYVDASDHSVQTFYEKRGWAFTGQLERSPDTGAPERVYARDLSREGR